MVNKMITKKSWQEFRDTGLFLFVNSILHVFGWVIVIEVENDIIKSCYPARTRYRGFSDKDVEESHKKISTFLKNTSSELEEEAHNG